MAEQNTLSLITGRIRGHVAVNVVYHTEICEECKGLKLINKTCIKCEKAYELPTLPKVIAKRMPIGPFGAA